MRNGIWPYLWMAITMFMCPIQVSATDPVMPNTRFAMAVLILNLSLTNKNIVIYGIIWANFIFHNMVKTMSV
jgi:hypothetical protein